MMTRRKESDLGLRRTVARGLTLWHDVLKLGPGVAEAVGGLIRDYADRAGLATLPPISLCGSGWKASWKTLAKINNCCGTAGGDNWEYEGLSLDLRLPLLRSRRSSAEERNDPTALTIENVIAHEIVHLRFRRLRHSPEFDARTLVLLRSGKFPHPGRRWSRATQRAAKMARQDAEAQMRALFEKISAKTRVQKEERR